MGKKINIRPTTSVYATYKNINYETYTAIAEFVDNSTQSFYDHKRELKETKYWSGCEVYINYDKDESGNYFLEITDNAYGMEFHDFERAIVLDSKPKNITRSEFGMGLKTAACWFGTKWTVESTALGSSKKYRTVIDVEYLSKYKDEDVEVIEESCSPKEHGTTIRIERLNRTIAGRSIGKTKDMLRGMYRVDLRTDEIMIYYNNERLHFDEPEVYEEQFENGEKKVWKEGISFSINHNDNIYYVDGEIAIRKTASTSEAGFTLIRNGRVIIGGYDNNYRPEEIFGKSNSFVYQRLTGELNLDKWPVVQTKDNFDWNNGLEDKLIDELKKVTSDYARKASIIRKRDVINAEESTQKMLKTLKDEGVIEDYRIVDITDYSTSIERFDTINENELLVNDGNHSVMLAANEPTSMSFTIHNTEYIFTLIIDETNLDDDWLTISKEDEDNYKIKWNVRHVFFESLSDKPVFFTVMQYLIFAFAIAEVTAQKSGENGLIDASDIRIKMNDILRKIGRGNK